MIAPKLTLVFLLAVSAATNVDAQGNPDTDGVFSPFRLLKNQHADNNGSASDKEGNIHQTQDGSKLLRKALQESDAPLLQQDYDGIKLFEGDVQPQSNTSHLF